MLAAVAVLVASLLSSQPRAGADVPPSSTPLAVGVSGLGATIGAPGEDDDYQFTVQAGAHYDAEVLNVASGLGDLDLTVLDSSGNDVGSDSDCFNGTGNVCGRVEFDVSISGTYYLDVRADDGGATGTYTVRVLPDDGHGLVHSSSGEPDDVLATAEPLSPGLDGALARTIYGRNPAYVTDRSDQDTFAFSGHAGVAYTAEVFDVATGLDDMSLAVYDSTGHNLGEDGDCFDGTGNVCGRVAFDVSIAGTYYLQVAPDDGNASGAYGVRVLPDATHGGTFSNGEDNDTTSLAYPLALGAEQTATIYPLSSRYVTPNTDIDFYRFHASAGHRYVADVTSVAASLDPTALVVSDSRGNVLGDDDECENRNGSICDQVVFDVSITGTYFLSVDADNGSASGSYGVCVYDSSAPSCRAISRAIADFDGNGRTDTAVYRASSHGWYARGQSTVTWGATGDRPVPADFTGDGRTDVAVYRPSNHTFYVRGLPSVAWGTIGDVPVPADYNGDGRAEPAVFRPSDGTWYIHGDASVPWGVSTDKPVPGDYNGDGRTDVAVFRPSTGTWFIDGAASVHFGASGDIPVPGDYNGDGRTDVAVFRPSTGTWYVRGAVSTHFGASGDVPLPAVARR